MNTCRTPAATAGVVLAGGGVPDWFGPALATGLAPVFKPHFDKIDAIFDKIDVHFDNIKARQHNSAVNEPKGALYTIRNPAAIVAPNFPTDVMALNIMNQRQMQAFLHHYKLPKGGSNNEKQRHRIKRFIGMCMA